MRVSLITSYFLPRRPNLQSHSTATREASTQQLQHCLETTKTFDCSVTYNRELFLQEQFESIVSQSRPPDEVVIGDARSTDSTLRIIKEFAPICRPESISPCA